MSLTFKIVVTEDIPNPAFDKDKWDHYAKYGGNYMNRAPEPPTIEVERLRVSLSETEWRYVKTAVLQVQEPKVNR